MSNLFKSKARRLGLRGKPSKAKASKPVASETAAPKLLDVTGLALDGRGVARYQGKTVFVAGALPGERVSLQHYRHNKRFDECQIRDYEQASSERDEPACPHFSSCGGCQLQHLKADAQIVYKQASVLELLARQASVTPEFIAEPILSPSEGYRTRARLAVSKMGQLSFRQEGSDELVAIRSCLVLDTRLQALLAPLQQWLDSLLGETGRAKPVAVTHIELVAVDSGVGVLLRHPEPVSVEQRTALQHLLADFTVGVWWQAKKHGALMDYHGLPCDPSMSYQLHDLDLQLTFKPANFTQVNASVNQAMVARTLEWLALNRHDHVLDLFCGIGNFTLPLARFAARVVGVEAIENMVAQGRLNAVDQGLDNVDFKALDLTKQGLGEFMAKLGSNKLVLDPPRSGAREVCEEMHESGVQRFVYISCNPASLARDAAILKHQGYRMVKFCVLDMFPHTAHVESMALFQCD